MSSKHDVSNAAQIAIAAESMERVRWCSFPLEQNGWPMYAIMASCDNDGAHPGHADIHTDPRTPEVLHALLWPNCLGLAACDVPK